MSSSENTDPILDPMRKLDRWYPTWLYRGMLIQKPGSVYLIGPCEDVNPEEDGDLEDVWDMATDLQTARFKVDCFYAEEEKIDVE